MGTGDPADPRRDLAGAIHDVSNALTVVLGWIGEARAPGASRDSVAHALGIVERRARAARDLARRAIGVHVALPDENCLLDVVLAETLDALAVEAERSGVRLHRSNGGDRVCVPAGSDLSEIVTNLVMNALAQSPPGGVVTVTVGKSSHGVHVDVEDDGPGVPTEQRSTLFDGHTTRADGAGIGLRHARAMARSSGGDLDLIPRPRGALFRITWPHVGAPASAPPSATRVRTLEGMRVLLVEDDIDVTMLLETALGARGAHVVIARDAAELTEAVTGGQHDAALIDLSPIAHDVDGAIAALRARSPGISIVFITGSAERLPGIGSDAAGRSVCWVRKPFDVAEVVAALSDAKKKAK